MYISKTAVWLLPCLALASGCTTVRLDAGFSEVGALVRERTGFALFWNNGTELDRDAAAKLGQLLKNQLSADQAVQLALLNNRDLQAAYADLGVAQADLVQAGLLSNPIFDGALRWPTMGRGRPEIELAVVMNFLEIFYLPLRQRVAAARFEEVQSRLSGLVLDFAGRVRAAFYNHQANQQLLELRQTIVQALGASFDVTRRLHEAGNITDLEYARERAFFEAGKLALRGAEMAQRQSREDLNILMGLWGGQTDWQAEARLADPPRQPIGNDDVERVALERSVDLLNARQRMIVAGEQLGLNRATALAPEAHVGAMGERGGEGWGVGPVLELPIPLFDQGQGRTARAAAELRRAQQEYYALAVKIRATARALLDRAQGAQERALYLRDIMLPLHERIVNESQLHYNAMQLGPVQLLRAREQQVEMGAAYVEALRDFWLARAALDQLFAGRLPSSEGGRSAEGAGAMVGGGARGRGPEGH